MKKALIIALIAAPILLAMSYPGREASSGPLYVFSAIGWFGFMIAVLAVLVISVAMVVRRATRRTPAADRA
jgi:uncharacterized membrane protein YhaH (DUF805 family)